MEGQVDKNKLKLLKIFLLIILIVAFVAYGGYENRWKLLNMLVKIGGYGKEALSEETSNIIKELEDEVKISFINYEADDITVNFAQKYKQLNSNIKIEEINDITLREDLKEKYSLNINEKLIVVSSGKNEKTLSEYDLYTYDDSTYETIDTTEEAFTNAIIEVTSKEKTKIYFMSNHAKYEVKTYFSTIMNSMKNAGNEVEILNILSERGIPENCDTLVITTLDEDITSFEKRELINYINRGGNMLLLIGPNINGNDLTNFEEILYLYGITIEDGVIFEGDSSNMLYGYPDFIIEKMQSSSLTEKLNMNLSVCLADAASIKLNADKKDELKVNYEELVYTSSKAFRRTDLELTTTSKTDSDSEESKFLVGGIANKKIDENTNSRLVIFGNELFTSDMQVSTGGYFKLVELHNNEDVILKSIDYLNEKDDKVTIRNDTDDEEKIKNFLIRGIVIAVIIIILLLSIIIVGIIVWQVRRRKK